MSQMPQMSKLPTEIDKRSVRNQPAVISASEDLLNQIEVTAPYYAFKDLSIDHSDSVHGVVHPEQPMGMELGVMSAAEAGRHLAILGSCALASSNPKKEKHFYIAHSAKYRSYYEPIDLTSHRQNVGRHVVARTVSIDKRQGIAYAQLNHDQHRIAADLTTKYHIIKAASFKRLYAAFECDFEKPETSPYAQTVDLDDIKIKKSTLMASFGPVSPEQCSGHFDGLPCLPVAILMYLLSKGASHLVNHIETDQKQIVILSADISADKFAFAGQSIQVSVELLEKNESHYKCQCTAADDSGDVYGSMVIEIMSV